jgi:biopolymer transport protein ExbD
MPRPRPAHARPLLAGLLAITATVPAIGLSQDDGQSSTLLTLPESTAEQVPVPRCHVVVTKEAVVVDGVQIIALEAAEDQHGAITRQVPDEDKRGVMITALYDRLQDKYDQAQLLAEARQTLAVLTQRRELGRSGELLLSIDAEAPFSVVREVLYTAGQAQFSSFLFVTHNPWEDAQRTIESSLPRIGPPRGVDDDSDPPLNLSIPITAQGLSVLGADGVLFPEGAADSAEDDPGTTLPCRSGGACTGIDDYDWAGLSRMLALVKASHPDDHQFIVVPDRDVPFEIIVRVLDIARWAPHLPMDAEREAWERWQRERETLFPFPILAGGAS